MEAADPQVGCHRRSGSHRFGRTPVVKGYYQPTFLYELVWLVIVAGLVVWLDRRLRLGHGRAFALYVALYCVGRLVVEKLRTDEAEIIFGQRLNVWTSLIVGLAALAFFVVKKGDRDASVFRDGVPAPTNDGQDGAALALSIDVTTGSTGGPLLTRAREARSTDDPPP